MEFSDDFSTELEVLKRASRDILRSSALMGRHEARYLVDTYYQMQDDRIRSAAQVRELTKSEEPNSMLVWLQGQNATLEAEIKKALTIYAASSPTGEWSLSIRGIGGVLAAGLLAHIDIERSPTAGNVWSFAGIESGQKDKWKKGEKRPWNAKLKTLTWKIGESFVKQSGGKGDIYGQIYLARKKLEWERNLKGQFADQAKAKLESVKIGKGTDAYKWYSGEMSIADALQIDYFQGGGWESWEPSAERVEMLPPAHIQARAKRYAVKLFLSHWHEVAYMEHFKKLPPAPYVMAHAGHVHYIPVPNYDKSKWGG